MSIPAKEFIKIPEKNRENLTIRLNGPCYLCGTTIIGGITLYPTAKLVLSVSMVLGKTPKNTVEIKNDKRFGKRMQSMLEERGCQLVYDAETNTLIFDGGENGIRLDNKDIIELHKIQKLSEKEHEILEVCRAAQDNKNEELIELLKKNPAKSPQLVNSMHKKDWPPLRLACHTQSFDTARTLIEYGAEVNIYSKKTRSTISFLDLIKEKKVAEELRSLHAFCKLSVAVKNNSVSLLTSLLKENNFNLNTIFQFKGVPMTLLHFACHFQSKESVQFLIESGASITVLAGKKNVPALTFLKDKDFANAMMKLVETKNSDVNLSTTLGFSAGFNNGVIGSAQNNVTASVISNGTVPEQNNVAVNNNQDEELRPSSDRADSKRK